MLTSLLPKFSGQTITHQKSQKHPFQHATEHPLDNSSENPLGTWQSNPVETTTEYCHDFGKCHWKSLWKYHWNPRLFLRCWFLVCNRLPLPSQVDKQVAKQGLSGPNDIRRVGVEDRGNLRVHMRAHLQRLTAGVATRTIGELLITIRNNKISKDTLTIIKQESRSNTTIHTTNYTTHYRSPSDSLCGGTLNRLTASGRHKRSKNIGTYFKAS